MMVIVADVKAIDGIVKLSLFNRIEKLPLELIGCIVECSLFSEPLGSHDVLHTLQVRAQEEEDSIINGEGILNNRIISFNSFGVNIRSA